jgi:hypothetical protein
MFVKHHNIWWVGLLSHHTKQKETIETREQIKTINISFWDNELLSLDILLIEKNTQIHKF